LVAKARLNILVLKSYNKLQVCWLKTKCSFKKCKNHGILAKNMAKRGILAKSWHLMKIMVSVISELP